MPDMPDVVVLCGGSGSRLKPVTGNVPKALATISGRPFLEVLLLQLSRHGFRRVILAAGPHETLIRKYFGVRAFGLDLVYPQEPGPLGTGGAVRNAAGFVVSESVLIMNGDSYTEVELDRFVSEYDRSRGEAWIVVVPALGRKDCGTVIVSENGTVIGFEEKQTRFVPHFANAGIYLVSRQLLFSIPPGLACSWEALVLPQWVIKGRQIRSFLCSGRCIDIGTPDRYLNAQHILAKAEVEM